METFKIGDSVRLKSGGPVMSISAPVAGFPGRWDCAWFDQHHVLQHGRFHQDMLEIDNEDEG